MVARPNRSAVATLAAELNSLIAVEERRKGRSRRKREKKAKTKAAAAKTAPADDGSEPFELDMTPAIIDPAALYALPDAPEPPAPKPAPIPRTLLPPNGYGETRVLSCMSPQAEFNPERQEFMPVVNPQSGVGPQAWMPWTPWDATACIATSSHSYNSEDGFSYTRVNEHGETVETNQRLERERRRQEQADKEFAEMMGWR